MIGFVVLGLTACGQRQEGSPSAAGSEAAKPDVSAGANQDASSCLDLVAGANYSDAVPVCTRALNMDQNNEKLKTALQTANAKLAEGEADEAAKGANKSY
jgi:hypothetical protein